MGQPARSAYGTAVAGGSASIYYGVDTDLPAVLPACSVMRSISGRQRCRRAVGRGLMKEDSRRTERRVKTKNEEQRYLLTTDMIRFLPRMNPALSGASTEACHAKGVGHGYYGKGGDPHCFRVKDKLVRLLTKSAWAKK